MCSAVQAALNECSIESAAGVQYSFGSVVVLMAGNQAKPPVFLVQEDCGCCRCNQIQLSALTALFTESFFSSLFHFLLLLSSSERLLRKNYEFFHWESKAVLSTKGKHAFKCMIYERFTLLLFTRLQHYQVSEKADAKASDFDVLIFSLFLLLCLEI